MLVLFTSILVAQTNYIRNESFESANFYPTRPTPSGITGNPFSAGNYPTYWTKPTNGSADFISDVNQNTCSYNTSINPTGPWVCPADNWMGCENPHTGDAYMGIYTSGMVYGTSTFREMLQCEIDPAQASNGLVAGQCYTLSFYVSRADFSEYATPIQVNFSSAQATQYEATAGYFGTMGLTAHLESPTITQTSGWTLVTFGYTATGGEKWMTIGFFEEEEINAQLNPKIQYVGAPGGWCTRSNDGGNKAYYYIDDVTLTFSGGNFTPSSGYVFSNTTINNANWQNKNVLLNGNITFTGSSTIDNCTIHCTKTCTITIANGADVTNTGTTYSSGCGHMWNGARCNRPVSASL